MSLLIHQYSINAVAAIISFWYATSMKLQKETMFIHQIKIVYVFFSSVVYVTLCILDVFD